MKGEKKRFIGPDGRAFIIGLMGSTYVLFADKFFSFLFQSQKNPSFWTAVSTFSLMIFSMVMYYVYCCRKSSHSKEPRDSAKATVQKVRERLRTINALKRKNEISADEYKRLREKILNEI